MKWFKNVQTVEELRKQYRILLKKYHPDNPGGSVGATQEINREYDELFDILSRQQNADDPKKTYSTEENAHFKEIPLEQIREKYGTQKLRKRSTQTALED